MADLGIEHFELVDRWGDVQQYTCMHHPVDDGMGVMAEVSGLSIPSVTSGLSAALENTAVRTAFLEAISGGWDVDGEEFLQLMAGVDWTGLGQEAGKAMASGQVPGLMKRLLAHCSRGGVPLSNPAAYDRAFRANYLEAYKAAWKVCTINGFFPDLPTSKATSPPSPEVPKEAPLPVETRPDPKDTVQPSLSGSTTGSSNGTGSVAPSS